MKHTKIWSWKSALFGILFLTANIFFIPDTAFGAGPRIVMSKPAAQAADENIYRWGDTIELRYEFGAKAENFQPLIRLEGCRIWFSSDDPEQREVDYSIPLKLGPLSDNRGSIQWYDENKDGFLRGEANIRVQVRDENGDVINYKDIVKKVFWVEHPAKPLPGAISLPGSAVFQQGDEAKVIVATPPDDWKITSDNALPEYNLVFMRPSLVLPGGAVTTERFGKSVKLPRQRRAEMDIDIDLSPGSYEIRLMRDNFILDTMPITVKPKLPKITFKQSGSDPNITVTISVADFPGADEENEPSIGFYINDGDSEYPHKVFPDGYFEGQWSKGTDWDVNITGTAGKTITTLIAYPYKKYEDFFWSSFGRNAQSIEVAQYTIKPDIETAKQPVIDPGWYIFKRRQVFSPGEKFSINFGDVNNMSQHEIDYLRPFSLVVRKNTSWKDQNGKIAGQDDIEVKRFEVTPQNLTLKGTMPAEPGDYRLNIESDGFVAGGIQEWGGIDFKELNMAPGGSDTEPVAVDEAYYEDYVDDDSTYGGFEDETQANFDDYKKEKPVVIMDNFPFSILGDDPQGFEIEIDGGDKVPAGSDVVLKVRLPHRKLSERLYLRISQAPGVSGSGTVFGESYVISKLLWHPPTLIPGENYYLGKRKEFPEVLQDIEIKQLSVPGDYEASIIMPPHYKASDQRLIYYPLNYEDYIVPTKTILTHRFQVVAPSIQIGDINFNEKQSRLEVAVDIAPQYDRIKDDLLLIIPMHSRLTLDGVVHVANPEYGLNKFDVLPYDYDANTINFKRSLSSPDYHFEIQLVYKTGCFLGECPTVILDSKWLTGPDYEQQPRELLAKAPEDIGIDREDRRFPDLSPIDGQMVALDDKADSNVAPKEFITYEAPPTLTLSTGYYPLDASDANELHLGFRLVNRSHKAAKGVTLNVQLFDEYLGQQSANWKASSDEFVPHEDGTFACYVESLGPNEAVDFLLAGAPPQTGALLWVARWEAETEFIGERTATGRIKTGKPVVILDIITLADQKAFDDYIYACPYPFGRIDKVKNTIDWLSKTRGLFVVGKNILKSTPKLRWNSFTSNEQEVSYSLKAMPDTENAFWREKYERAWLRFTGGQASSAGDSGLEGILVRATFKEGILPGSKKLRVNGGEGSWNLRFGDIKGKLMFVRESVPGLFEPIDTAYLPETIRIAITTNLQLPITEILVDMHTSKEGFGKRQTLTMTARLAPQLGERVYITPPIGLSEKNKSALTLPPTGEYEELMLDIIGGEVANAVALAEVNAEFAKMTFAIPIDPPQAQLSLFRTPANEEINYLWKEALKRAAVCNEIEVKDWDKLNAMEVDEIWNIIVFTMEDHYLSEKVKLGHQAAMILLRDIYKVMTRKEIETLKNIQTNDKAVRGFLKYMSEFWMDEGFPVNRMDVTAPDGNDTIPFGFAAFDNDEFQAEEFSTEEKTFTADDIAAWRIRAARQALAQLQKAATESIKMAGEAGDCEIEDLLKITGFGFDAVHSKLTPKLMKLKEVKTATGSKRLYWVPDQQARDWVASVAYLAAAVKKQQDSSSADTDLILTAAAVITMPLMLSESAVVMLTVFAIDLLDLAVTSVKEISQYRASQWEQEFSEGASVTIGIQRNKRAVENAKGWASTAFAIGTSALGAAGGVFDAMDALPKLALARKVAKGRKVARALETGGLGKLNEPDLEDFVTFAIDSKTKALTSGMDSLSTTQRRAIDIIDAAAANRKGVSASKITDTPPPANVARIEFDPASGKATMPTDSGIKLKKPQPLSKSARGPPRIETPTTPVKTNINIDQSSPEIDTSIIVAKAGTEVTDPRPFGMMAEAMKHFQKTVDKFMLKVRVRAANISSLKWMHKGHPPKHVKLKSKTINNLDVQLGARPGSQGLVGYFKPKEPPNYAQLSKMDDPPKIVSRYKQRLNEYYDNWKDMEKLKQKGLVSVDDGVVMDRGLSSTRLDPKTGKLKPFRGQKEGTGKGFTGDYDMWDITHPDGSRIIMDPKARGYDAGAAKRKNELLEELGSGTANTQHGPHKDWIPTNKRDIDIDTRIRNSHRGQRMPDGSIGPLKNAETGSQSEALLEFSPGNQPKVSYEFDVPSDIIHDVSKTDSISKLVVFTDVDGQIKYIPIRNRLGEPGSTSVAYLHAEHPDTLVVRITTEKPGHPAVKLDDYGRKVLDEEIFSDNIRAAKQLDRWDVPADQDSFTRVTVVEKIVPIKEAMRQTGGIMTKAQQNVFENALRDLNRQGYVWLDNKWDNFGFVKNAAGKLQVVVLDTGGIVKIAGNAESAKRLARTMQIYVNGPLSEIYPSATRLPVVGRIGIREAEIKEKFMEMVDLKAIGLDDISQIKFTPSSGEQFDYIGPSFFKN